MDYSKLTLGELLSDKNETVRRNAQSILKIYQKQMGAIVECNVMNCHEAIDLKNCRYFDGRGICDLHAAQIDGAI